eukprot:g14258.t1
MHSTFFQSGGAYGQSYSSTYGQGTHVAANTAVHVDAGSGYVDGYAGANNDADYEMAMSAVAAEFPLSQQEITERPGEMTRKTHFGAGRGLQECSAL